MGAYVRASDDGYFDVYCDEQGCEGWAIGDFDHADDANRTADYHDWHHEAYAQACANG